MTRTAKFCLLPILLGIASCGPPDWNNFDKITVDGVEYPLSNRPIWEDGSTSIKDVVIVDGLPRICVRSCEATVREVLAGTYRTYR